MTMRRHELINLLSKFTTFFVLLISCSSVLALSTDKDQPIEIEADAAELDDMKRISIYTGNVIVIQGSILMTGDKMVVHHKENDDVDKLFMDGKPATYRQLPDNSDVYDEGEALRMEYYEGDNLVILIREAWAKQGDTLISGNRIEYDTELSQVKAWSKPKDKSKTDTGDEGKKRKRVKITIKKKKEDTGADDAQSN